MPPSIRAAADRLARSIPVLVITDFDGTLAPIVRDPPAARILPAARRALRRLAAIAGRGGGPVVVVVLSGRDAADVAHRVAVAGVRYLGQHGIEAAQPGAGWSGRGRLAVTTDPALVARGREIAALANRVASLLGAPEWLVVETKGASVGLHYRLAPDPERARAALLGAIEAAQRDLAIEGVRRLESRRVVELRPAAAFGKGEAARRIIAEVDPGSILVLGDDRTDAEAFEVVDGWRTATGRPALILGVSGASETPPEIESLADALADDPAVAAAVLDALAAALEAPVPPGA